MRSEIGYDALDRVTQVRRYVPSSAATVSATETYAYNALGGFSIYDGAVADDQRPRLDGSGKASAAVPATFGGQPVAMDGGGSVTAFNGAALEYFNFDHHVQTLTIAGNKQTYTYDSLGRLIGTHVGPPSDQRPTHDENYFYSDLSGSISSFVTTPFNPGTDPAAPPAIPNTDWNVGYDGVDHPLWISSQARLLYPELDAIGNVRHLHVHVDPLHPTSQHDLGGHSYSAFGKTLVMPDSDVAPGDDIPFGWQGKRLVAPNMYDSRARMWSADLGAFLQPDEYGYLTSTGTLWSWPGQNPYRWRDPSGHYFDAAAAAAAAVETGEASAALGALPLGIAAYAGYNIFNQIWDWKHPIISHADPDKPGVAGKEPCPDASDSSSGAQADSSGGGAKGPPAGAGDVGADAPDPGDFSGIPAGPGGRMLGQGLSQIQNASPSERSELTEELIRHIEANSTDQWRAARMPGANGANAWMGDTHSLVVDAEGNMFKGPNSGIQPGTVGGRLGLVGWGGLKPL